VLIEGRELKGGVISWMARNPVASNLLMAVLLLGGLIVGSRVKQEVFPEFTIDAVQIRVPYPGASPEEVEEGILLAVEEGVRGVDGVKKVTSNAFEGSGTVRVELTLGTDSDKALQDCKLAVDRITTFPRNAERPTVSLLSNRREVISLVVYGSQGERQLRDLAERVRMDLTRHPDVTLVELDGTRPLEIAIEVPQENLRAHGLTLEGVAAALSRSSLDLPGGGVKAQGGEVLLRLAERRDLGAEFADIPVVSRPDGTWVRLDEIASINDGFADTDQATYYNGKPAVRIVVFRVGDQGPLEVAAAVKEYISELREDLPEGVGISVWEDWSDIYRQRINLLLRNAGLGLVLVLLILGLFLEPKLAFWVTLGIPISFLGSFLLFPVMDVSINMISLFAFIITLGIVVDDAIVVGENIFEHRQRGLPFQAAAIAGAREIAVPVTFAILTNVAAFSPLFFVPGFMGKLFRVIPSIVVAVFLVSLVEALVILPAHLAHQGLPKEKGPGRIVSRLQQRFMRIFNRMVGSLYGPVLRFSLRNRYVTICFAAAILILTVGYVAGGRIGFTFMPTVDSDVVTATVEMPFGIPVARTEAVKDRLLEAAQKVLDRHGGEEITKGILNQVGFPAKGMNPGGDPLVLGGGHLANVQVLMVPSDERPVSATAFAREWREEAGDLPDVETLVFRYTAGPSAGPALNIELSHDDGEVLEEAALDLAEALAVFSGVKDIDKGFAGGKRQMDFTIRPAARSQGLTAADVGRQVRAAFFGVEALRQQRGRDEIKIMVRLPERDRRSEHDIEGLLIQAPGGGEIPLLEATEMVRGRAYTEINRTDGRRIINVTADIEEGTTDAGTVITDLRQGVLPELLEKYRGLSYSLEGERREQRESLSSLLSGFLVAMILIFGLLAIPFRSYIQPLLIMAAIPFGIVGAVAGHVIMGYGLSVISLMGIVALTGVVVNDSLILVDTANRIHRAGATPFESITAAGVRRFRPILLTSLTTFFGLAPMIFESSLQARFLIPMAISLGFGILFSTVIVLLIVPSLFLVVEDVRHLFGFAEMAPPEGKES
jgi:multidrug efflux pump subunit AcrB